MSASNGSSEGSLRWSQVLEEEYESLHPPPEERGKENKKEEDQERLAKIHEKIEKEKHSALCISGGGIRSATFALGVLQGLASIGWLQRLDYLSTVSGGGYIGSWLTSWIHRHEEGVEGVAGELKVGKVNAFRPEPEPKPVQHLRSYSNYLSPRLGLLSADTWTLVATYLRNLVLNWLVFVPLLMAAVMVPRLCFTIVRRTPASWPTPTPWPPDWTIQSPDWLAVFLSWFGGGQEINGVVALGFMLSLSAIFFTTVSRPRYSNPGQTAILVRCLLPLFGAAACFTTYWAWRNSGHNACASPAFPWLTIVWWGVLVHLFGGLLCLIWLVVRKKIRDMNELMAFGGYLVVMLIAGAAVVVCAWLVAIHVFPNPADTVMTARSYVCFAVPLFTMGVLVAGTLLMGLASSHTDDQEREWWGRFGAWIMIAMAAWMAVSTLVEFGPQLMDIGIEKAKPAATGKAEWLWRWALGAVGGVSGLIAILGGKSAGTPATDKANGGGNRKSALINKGLLVAATVFGAVALVWLSALTLEVVKFCVHFCKAWNCPFLATNPAFWMVLMLIVVLTLGAAVMAWFININKFSLHAMYRARLIRAYLGASRTDDRDPDLFIGFDPNDNIAMCDLGLRKGEKPERKKPFHVINVALNLVAGKRLAWQKRKAESFTITPLHCGSAFLSPESGDSTLSRSLRGAYRKSDAYGKGGDGHPISLGTALTISGAAFSPNMGYHSSPGVAFLLTLFNMRLGAWLGNPGPAGEYRPSWFARRAYELASPRLAVLPLLREAFGLTDDSSPFVYLSDGGHFENLGLYEMVRRRCRYIIVCDGGADPKYQFEDLVNAIRKCRTDLGIRITIDVSNVGPHAANTSAKPAHCAIGRIYYDDVDPGAKPGRILYIKASLNGNEPLDVKSYAEGNRPFPHQSTGDQFFDENQFESYRALGLHVAREIFSKVNTPECRSFDDLFQDLGEHWPSPPRFPSLSATDTPAHVGAQTSSSGTSPGPVPHS